MLCSAMLYGVVDVITYRGCMMGCFLVFIALASLLFASIFGIAGLLLPPALIGFGYLLVDTILVELIWWLRDRNG